MITFEHVPPVTLNPETGQTTGLAPKPQPANIGMDTAAFHQQLSDLVAKKVPIEQAMKAIDQHPEITDKPRAKSMATAYYDIAKPTK